MAANLPTRAPLLDQIMKVATQPRRPPGKGEWRMEVRGWRMDGGGRRLEDGEWGMDDGGLRVEV